MKAFYVGGDDNNENMNNVTDQMLNDFVNYSRKYSIDSFKAVKKCWWNNKEIECNGQFFNHLLDTGFCFTFNETALT